MATAERDIERDIVMLKKDQSLKGKQEMLSPKSNKNLTGGNVDQSGEDTPDSVPSSQASGPDIKELVKYTQGVSLQPKQDEKRDLEKAESEDNTDAMPSNKPIARVSAVPQSTVPLPQQPCDEEVSTRTRPFAVASPGTRCEDGARQGVERNTVEQTVVPPSTLQQQPCDEEVSTRTSPSSVASPGPRCEDGARQGVEGNPIEQTADSEDNTDAVPSNEPTATVTSEPQSTVPLPQQPCDEEVSTRTRPSLDASPGARQGVERNTVDPISDVIPQTETTGRNSKDEFYDIFLVHSGKNESTKKFQTICERHEWVVKSIPPIGTQVHENIERMLNSSTHLALIITESDCIKYKNQELSMTVEMALQLAYNVKELAGKVLPIRCCNKKSLPLVLQALTSAHIDEESFEERLVATIDTKTRKSRMREKQN